MDHQEAGMRSLVYKRLVELTEPYVFTGKWESLQAIADARGQPQYPTVLLARLADEVPEPHVSPNGSTAS